MTNEERKVIELALEALEEIALAGMSGTGQESDEAMTAWHARQAWKFIGIAARALGPIKEALAQPEQEPVAWKLVPIEPTRKMLEAMDECSMEGYDEHLYAGHAASVYMAAVDVAPTPPQPEKPDQDEVDIRSRLYQRIHELETQLAQPEQEPVEWGVDWGKDGNSVSIIKRLADGSIEVLGWEYAPHPPQRKPLSDEQIAEMWLEILGSTPPSGIHEDGLQPWRFTRAIEAAHGIKE